MPAFSQLDAFCQNARTKLLERLEKDLRVACADHPSDDDYLIFMRRLQMLKTKLVSNKEQVDNGKTRAEETINPFCNVAETQECLFNVCELGMSIKTTDKDLATDLRLTHFKDEVSSVCHDGATQAQLTTNQEESVKACEPHTKNVSDIVIARHLPTKTDNIAVPLFLLPGREKRAHKVTENSTNNVHMSSCGSHKIMQRDVSHSIAPSHLSVLKEADAPASLVLNQKVPFGYGCLIATGEQKTRIKDAVQSQERRSQILYNYQKALSTRFLTKTGVNVAIPIVLPTHVTAGISLVASNAEKLCGPIAEDATYNSSLISNRQVHHDRALGSRNKDRVKKYGDHTVSSHKSSSISLYDYQQALSVRLSTTTRKSAKSTDPCILPANVDAGISLLVQDVTDVQEMLPMRELPIDDIRRYADSVNRQIEQPSDVKSLVARFEKWCNAQGTN